MTGFYQKNTIVVLMGLLLLLSTVQAQSNQDCCLAYSKKPLHKKIIRGFTEQLSSEVCDINAVIFHTKKGRRACADPKEPWVKNHLRWLRNCVAETKKMLMCPSPLFLQCKTQEDVTVTKLKPEPET